MNDKQGPLLDDYEPVELIITNPATAKGWLIYSNGAYSRLSTEE